MKTVAPKALTDLTGYLFTTMTRLILNIDETGNPDPLTIEDAVKCALEVVKMGKISETSRGKQYCFHTIAMSDVHVAVTKQKSGTETFNIYLDNAKDRRK
jgi:hypothetical protein